MKNQILAQINDLAEALVLWNGTDTVRILEQFRSIGNLANDLGQGCIVETVRKVSRLLEEGKEDHRESILAHAGEVVSALQDVFSNGRDPKDLKIFQSEAASPISGTVAQYVDKKILSDFLARQDGLMEDF